jgi:hypothetical protein
MTQHTHTHAPVLADKGGDAVGPPLRVHTVQDVPVPVVEGVRLLLLEVLGLRLGRQRRHTTEKGRMKRHTHPPTSMGPGSGDAVLSEQLSMAADAG